MSRKRLEVKTAKTFDEATKIQASMTGDKVKVFRRGGKRCTTHFSIVAYGPQTDGE